MAKKPRILSSWCGPTIAKKDDGRKRMSENRIREEDSRAGIQTGIT